MVEGVQIGVVLQLLRCGVVLVVLDAPPARRHPATEAVQEHLTHTRANLCEGSDGECEVEEVAKGQGVNLMFVTALKTKS